ncbi:MAG: polyprenyl diphosphate synthase [Methanocellales archaeon]|nr:polyprenyl diphosphate synthase [Methanocellales archaeon]MDD3291779.1 polyprenyl diphosphate synthase [Methanocellales archaeon]MDD5235129.1 polyprenyl diphosphate synthase [Methanocellales archaeon]MDD5485267.1 polyprenyl diphosphate synthase [Methanocellales archaeon]
MKEIISALYERRIISQIEKEDLPKHIILVIAEDDLQTNKAFNKLKEFVFWCSEIKISRITVYISVTDKEDVSKSIYSKLLVEMRSCAQADVTIYTESEKIEVSKDGRDLTLDISIGFGGKYELSTAIKQIMQNVEKGEVKPEDVDEKMVESHLIFKSEPDLIIRTGGERLTNFLIWQAVYSELYFTDVNWLDFRKIDLLRAVRDYQKRQRRFGE